MKAYFFSCVLVCSLFSQAGYAATDLFGNTSIQTGDDDAVAYSFFDISTTSPALALTREGSEDLDDGSAVINLGAPFPCYGQSYSQLLVSANGYLSSELDDNIIDTSNDPTLPTTPSSGGGLRIYALHDDLELQAASSIHSQYFANGISGYPLFANSGVHVVQWNDVSFFGESELFSFQVFLFDNGTIHFVYGPGNPARGASSTTGIQNENGTDGLLVAANVANSIPDLSTATIFPPNLNLSTLLEVIETDVVVVNGKISAVSVTFRAESGTNYRILSGGNLEALTTDSAFSEILAEATFTTRTFQRNFDAASPAPSKLFLRVQEES